MKLLIYLAASAAVVVGTGVVTAGGVFLFFAQELPDHTALQAYAPPVTSRLHASNGRIIGEYARERRLFVPIEAIPRRLVQAFVSAEDKNFYTHPGFDALGIARAAVTNLQRVVRGERPHGASTITQQVARHFLLTNEVSYERKLKELLLATRIEQALDKDEIMELYLNDIFLGIGAYGVAAAAQTYFDKPLHGLDLSEMAYLAALPKGPANYHPIRRKEAAIERRNWVLSRMVEEGYITDEEADKAQEQPLAYRPGRRRRIPPVAAYFAEEVRRQLVKKYGEEALYEGGLSVRTTLDLQLQSLAHAALLEGLVAYDRTQGWRGAHTQIATDHWSRSLEKLPYLEDLYPWRMAVVLDVGEKIARIGLRSATSGETGERHRKGERGKIDLSGVAWVGEAENRKGKVVSRMPDVLSVGDVIYVRPANEENVFELVQVPEVQGGIVAIDPKTGRVRAMVGGSSFGHSQFNRATQALRQPGSAFKPIVYAAALENGYTPASVILDAPIELEQGEGKDVWRPENYSKRYYGPSTLRLGLERSRNLMTVRLARDIGMTTVVHYAKDFGIYDHLSPVLAMALGAGETSLSRMVSAYSVIANGGLRVEPILIDRVQDRFGRTIDRARVFRCENCDAWASRGIRTEPQLVDLREAVISSQTAFQLTSMLEGVVTRGTGSVVGALGRPLAGKTGTSNDEKDAWFVGFSPELAVGVFVGYDNPRTMGARGTGGSIAAPIFRDFMKRALEGTAPRPFSVPEGIQFVRTNTRTGTIALAGEGINEAYKVGQKPGENLWVYGGTSRQRQIPQPPVSGEAIDGGTGGLY